MNNKLIFKKYNLILSFAVINFLDKNKIYPLFNQIKSKTKKSGYNVISVFMKGDAFDNKKSNVYFFKAKELLQIYAGWRILKYDEFRKLDKVHGKPHDHKIALIIAQKP